MCCKALVDYVQYWTGDAYLGRDITLTGLTRGKGSRADPDEDSSGREKALYGLGRVSTTAYFSTWRLREGEGDVSASVKT